MKKRSGRIARYLAFAGLAICVLIGLLVVIARIAFRMDPMPKNAIAARVVSRDGTSIAYELTGRGPRLLLVSAALTDRAGNRRLAAALAEHFTVINYDRRGRGDSTDVQPWSGTREVEDIEALVDAGSGPVFLFGSSSGSALALDAASQLGDKIRGAFVYEPPFIVDASRPAVSETLSGRVASLARSRKTSAAVGLFFSDGVGLPGPAVAAMRLLMPGWSRMENMAHTIPYDLALLSGTQSGKLFPPERWSHNTRPTIVAVGSRSEAFFHTGARALAATLPRARYVSLDGRDHSAVLFAPTALANSIRTYFAPAST
jgi:pimeloyl-ACP methyl ester carboxylesterase